ncbi:hypothetical protein EG328_004253 [Venturia inaequalis]|uniref:Uncharacterized protein n=1 Tax=Venturia inaequalis TaxID=5025 RepID=A0A8H3UQ44_VENIN|nr:hypothetical protein EG328_004253 [Venturia inaequalis]KAE9989860.1 hypothetical protein EG327_002162 [Venturia inaequalis]RDI87703.1 hypothetical protein Vi05172_g2213 [Venturia inaequalis]
MSLLAAPTVPLFRYFIFRLRLTSYAPATAGNLAIAATAIHGVGGKIVAYTLPTPGAAVHGFIYRLPDHTGNPIDVEEAQWEFCDVGELMDWVE